MLKQMEFCFCTVWLLEVVVQYDVLWLVQVHCQLGDVFSCQAVGTKNSTVAHICPKHFILFEREMLR